jgi:hypothetical protein
MMEEGKNELAESGGLARSAAHFRGIKFLKLLNQSGHRHSYGRQIPQKIMSFKNNASCDVLFLQPVEKVLSAFTPSNSFIFKQFAKVLQENLTNWESIPNLQAFSSFRANLIFTLSFDSLAPARLVRSFPNPFPPLCSLYPRWSIHFPATSNPQLKL